MCTRFQALSHEDRELFMQTLLPQDPSQQQPGQQPSQPPIPMLVDGELQPSASAAPRLPEKNLPPPDPKYDGTCYWGRYAQTVQQWLVACNTPPALWGVRALVCLSGEASDYLH
jgi:hypothetical protein